MQPPQAEARGPHNDDPPVGPLTYMPDDGNDLDNHPHGALDWLFIATGWTLIGVALLGGLILGHAEFLDY